MRKCFCQSSGICSLPAWHQELCRPTPQAEGRSVLTCTPCVQSALRPRCCNATKLSPTTKHPGWHQTARETEPIVLWAIQCIYHPAAQAQSSFKEINLRKAQFTFIELIFAFLPCIMAKYMAKHVFWIHFRVRKVNQRIKKTEPLIYHLWRRKKQTSACHCST